MRKTTARIVFCSAACLVLLAGCNSTVKRALHSTHDTVSLGKPLSPLSPAEMIEFRPGDQVYFTSGRREKVTSVKDGKATWRLSSSSEKVRWHSFILPTTSWSNSQYTGTQQSSAAPADLWPLRVGNKAYFRTRITSIDKVSSSVYNGVRDWSCKVDGTERIALLSGEFSTYKVICDRTNSMGVFRQESIWYYAPEIGQPILKLNRYSSSKRSPSRYEIMAYQPSLRSFDNPARINYWRYFRDTLEKIPSGQLRIWKDRKKGHNIALIPLKTLQQVDGTYCRQYRVTVTDNAGARNGAGIACRDKRGGWRIPKRIDPERGVRFRD